MSIFVSSFLILTIEKNWWGGYLTSDKNSHVAQNFNEWLNNGKKMKVPNPSYLFENTVRLIVIGSSITFFLLMSFVEIIQAIITIFAILFNRLTHFFSAIFSSSIGSRTRYSNHSTPQGSIYKSTNQLSYESTIIISNIQMLCLMITIIIFATSLGFIQGTMDPESATNSWSTLSLFSEELDFSEKVGIVVGALSAVILEVIREMEVRHRAPYKESTGTFADSDNLNFDTDSEGDFSGGDFVVRRRSSGGGFVLLGMDDEESDSLVRF